MIVFEVCNYIYLFDVFVGIVEVFVDVFKFNCYVIYVFDYGVFVGFWFVVKYFECVIVFIF